MTTCQKEDIYAFQIFSSMQISIITHINVRNAQPTHGKGLLQASANAIILFIIAGIGTNDEYFCIRYPDRSKFI